jgi:hypothetical protein
MGAIRGFFLVIVSVLLLLTLFSSVLLLTLSTSLKYDNLQKESKEIVKGFLANNMDINSTIDKAYPFIQVYCQTNSEYVFNSGGYTITVPCSSALEGKTALIDSGVDSLIKGVYYKEYDCEFIKCIQGGNPLVLISKKSYDFFGNIFKISLAVILLLLVLTFFLIQNKTNLFVLTGILLIISSLPFLKLDGITNLIPDKTVSQIVGLFFSGAYSTSIKMIIIGAVVLVIGIILKIFKIGFSISDIISKFKKPVKKEAKAVKKKSKSSPLK